MAEDRGEPGGDASAKRKLGEHARDDAWVHLLRTFSTVILIPLAVIILIPMIGWLVVNKLDGIDDRLKDHDGEFDQIKSELGTIVANQSAGQAQRDAQQKQLDSFQTWLQGLGKRIDNLRR